MATPINLVQLSEKSQEGLLEYCRQTTSFSINFWDFRAFLTTIDKEYYRENDLRMEDQARAKIDAGSGNKKRLANIVVPIVEPQIETSLAYLVSVFLTGQPIFGVVSDPENIKQAKVFESMIDEHAKHGSWIREFMMFFRDGLKYNFHGIELSWCVEKTWAPFTEVSAQGVKSEQRQIVWQGNKIKRLDPYNTLFDMRVAPAEMHKKGEFAGYIELFSRIALKEFLQALPWRMNAKEAMESGSAKIPNRYHIPRVNWDSMLIQRLGTDFDWIKWANAGTAEINYQNVYEVFTRYCRIIPSDFGMTVPAKNTPQIWKLITVNDDVIVYAEKMTNAHNSLPILLGQPIEDGLNYQTKSLASRLIPIQDTASALWNAKLAARRRSVADRGLFDPLRIREADINSDNPSAKIPVRASAYGKPIGEAYYQIPFEDRDGVSFAQDAREMMQFANYVSGQNPAQQGQFVKGNKTMVEFENIMGNSSGRQQMMAQFIEAQIMVPVKEMLKINMLQYSTPGKIYSVADRTNYDIDPVALRQASLAFKIADGLLPSDKLISEETLQVAFQAMSAIPQLQGGYDIPKTFSYLMQTRGLDLEPFELAKPAQQIPGMDMMVPGQGGAPSRAPGETPTPKR